MAGITTFRCYSVKRVGASLCFTEMVSVNGLVRDARKSFELLQSSPDDRPLGVQLFGDDPLQLAEAARLIEGYCDLIDINMGVCPEGRQLCAGSALLREPERVRKSSAVYVRPLPFL